MGKGKIKSRIRKGKAIKPKWYYDACALRHGRGIVDEIRGKSIKKDILISYLTLGEAYGSCCNESEEFEEFFKDLFENIKKYITIVSNHVPDRLFNEIREECKTMKVADAMHIATAIENGCEILRTADRDIHGLTNATRKRLREISGIPNFKISKVK